LILVKNPPIRNVPVRFYDMVAETSGDAKDWLLLVPPIRNVRASFYDMAAETSLLLV
jgi:hypothetical protein